MRYRCPKCGCVFSDKKERCPSCYQRFVYPVAEEKQKVVEVKPEEKVEPKVEEVKPEVKSEVISSPAPIEEQKQVEKEEPKKLEKKGKSKFTGNTFGLIGWKIAGFFVTLFTLGICYPVALGWIYRWEVNNTVVNGHRMRFNGLASSLIPRWIIWMILSIITIGIYALTLPVRFQKWKVARMEIVD